MSAVRLSQWGWRHPGRRAWALRGVDLTIEHGERVLLLGSSGAGKSTLLRALAGLLDSGDSGGEDEGTLLVDGTTPATGRSRIGYLQQDPESQLVMSRAGDDVAFGLENRAIPAEEIWPRVDTALAATGFSYGRDRSTAALSGGEQQRLALAGVVALEPKLLLLDEPTANLDPEGATLVRQAVQRVLNSTGATLILVEHRVTEALPLVDRVVVLEPGGGVLADGPPAEVFDRHRPELVAAGVWVPGYRVDPVRSQVPEPGRARLLTGSELNFEIGKQPVLAGVSVHASAGELVALTGPNGAGKSTLARILGGLLKPAQGSLVPTPLLAGMDSRPPWRWRSGELASRIGTVFQDPEHQFLTGRVRDELLLGPSRSGKLSPRQSGAPGSRRPGKLSPRQSGAPGSRRPGSLASAAGEKADELLALLRLEHLAEANPFTLSGGEQRRLSVATALASSPGLLILDEPTFGQDLRTWTELLRLLARARTDGAGLIVVTHDEAFVAAIADRTLTLAAGRLRDPARETANEPRENSAIPGNFSAPRENTPHENTPRENMGSPGNFIPPHENTPRENMGSPGNSTELTEGKK